MKEQASTQTEKESSNPVSREKEIAQSHIEIEYEDEKRIRIRSLIVKEEERILDLSKLLPSSADFLASHNNLFQFWPSNPRQFVEFPADRVNLLSGRLGILHEMGHAVDAARSVELQRGYYGGPSFYYDPNLIEIARDVRTVLNRIYLSPQFNRLLSITDQERYVAKHFQDEMGNFRIKRSAEEIDEFVKKLAHTERIAWACALKLYRKIRKENGIDFLGGVESKEISRLIESDLKSYQDLYGLLVPQETKLFLSKLNQ